MGEHVVLDRLSKVYSGGNRALSEVSIDIEPGTFLVLLGPSGSGKTTLLRSVAGIERITDGEITIGDRLAASKSFHLPPERRNISMVFQDYALWPHLAARDNVAFALRRRSIKGERARSIADAMLERVGLGHLGDRYPNELSGGEQQRVALARALVADTGLVLCDEPLSNLDADLRERMRLEIASLVREDGATTIYITHDQAEAFALADVVGVLEHGNLVQLAPPEVIYESPVSPFGARFTGLAGEFPVQIIDRGADGSARVIPTGTRTPCAIVARNHLGNLLARHGMLMIRPAALTIHAPDAPEVQLLGMVSDVAFRGRGYEHAVVLDNGILLSGIFSPVRAIRGDRVGLSINSVGAQLYDAPAVETAEDSFAGEEVDEREDPGIDLSKEFTRLA